MYSLETATASFGPPHPARAKMMMMMVRVETEAVMTQLLYARTWEGPEKIVLEGQGRPE